MKKCEGGSFCKCNGQSINTKYYEVYSGKIEPTYSERFWGVVAYCEAAVKDEEDKGYTLLEVEPQRTYIL